MSFLENIFNLCEKNCNSKKLCINLRVCGHAFTERFLKVGLLRRILINNRQQGLNYF